MSKYIYSIMLLLISIVSYSQKIDPRVLNAIDNLGYWDSLAKHGVIKPNPAIKPPPSIYRGSAINSPLIALTNSLDVVIDNTADEAQSENSVFINPLDKLKALNTNNSENIVTWVNHGSSYFTTTNQALNWQGSVNGAAGDNWGDPSAAISSNAIDRRYYISYLYPTFSLGIAVSTDEGVNWTRFPIHIGSLSDFFCDKPHMCVDNSKTSLFPNNPLYAAWWNIGWPQFNQHVGFSRSTDGGITWDAPIGISGDQVNGDSHQGVNLHCGPKGEVYATWPVYPPFNPDGDELALGFSRSLDGGLTFEPPIIIANSIHGTRTTGVGKNMGTKSFPTMAVDNSFGPNRGSIYVVWANVGTPPANTGNDVDLYMVKSIDNGITWSAPQQINASIPGQGKKHFFPWITCDQTTGKIHVIYYDDRNVASTDLEAWMSSSFDGGTTWDDYRVSDVSFTPVPFGSRPMYFGDYLGVTADDDVIYPVWTDNRIPTGRALAYTSPLISNDFCPVNLSLQNINQPLVATYKYRAQEIIAVAGTDAGGSSTSFIMQGDGVTGARCSMIAGKSITLLPNTSIERGAVLTIVPGVCSSPILRPPGFSNSNEFTKLKIQAKEFEINSKINLYPNPVNNIIYLELSELIENGNDLSYVITDLMARPFLKGKINKRLVEIKTNTLRSGGYFLSVYENEKLIETKTFVKK